MSIGENIKQLRTKLGMTQEVLAEKLEMNRSSLVQIERGRRKVSVEELIKFAEVMNVSVDQLINPDLKPEEIIEPSIEEPSVHKSRERISIPQNNFQKFKEVLLYILARVGARPNIGETVLYKILYFIDFNYYEKYEEQLIGATYIKNKYGPTPTHFHKLIESMKKSGDLVRVAKEYYNYPQTKYLPCRKPDISKLSATELDTINDVLNRLGEMNATQISEYSHKDIPWITTEDGDQIKYESVFYRSPEYSMRGEECKEE